MYVPCYVHDRFGLHPEVRGGFSRTGNYFTLSKTIRRNSKRIVRDFVDDLLTTKIRPLVETGQAEATAIAGHRVEASATATRSRVSITVPFGGYVSNAMCVSYLFEDRSATPHTCHTTGAYVTSWP